MGSFRGDRSGSYGGYDPRQADSPNYEDKDDGPGRPGEDRSTRDGGQQWGQGARQPGAQRAGSQAPYWYDDGEITRYESPWHEREASRSHPYPGGNRSGYGPQDHDDPGTRQDQPFSSEYGGYNPHGRTGRFGAYGEGQGSDWSGQRDRGSEGIAGSQRPLGAPRGGTEPRDWRDSAQRASSGGSRPSGVSGPTSRSWGGRDSWAGEDRRNDWDDRARGAQQDVVQTGYRGDAPRRPRPDDTRRPADADRQPAGYQRGYGADAGSQARRNDPYDEGDNSWRARQAWDEARHRGEPAYGSGYYGNSGRGGQSYNGGQRVYPGDPGYRSRYSEGYGQDFGTSSGTATQRSPRQGPKGYQRSDERIRDDICDRLAGAPTLDVRHVSVEVGSGVVTLTGTVRDRGQKYLIEDISEEVFGVGEVQNHIRVERGQGSASTYSSAGDNRGSEGARPSSSWAGGSENTTDENKTGPATETSGPATDPGRTLNRS